MSRSLLTEDASYTDVILDVRNLKTYFSLKGGFLSKKRGVVKAVDGVSFSVKRGETLGLVGESGCGKTTTGKSILRLIEPTEGEVVFEGVDLLSLGGHEMRKMRREMQLIYQDPYSSLNPRLTVGEIVGEPLLVHGVLDGQARKRKVRELLDIVGLATEHAYRYPHEFSGGQRQRIGIARALALNPKLIVCDEPVSALDVSIQSQILNLLCDLQEEFGLTYIFIAHGLAAVKHISQRVAVMYLGKIVEIAGSKDIYQEPLHPYTRGLISAIPVPNPRKKKERILLEGDVPSPINPPDGCRFHTRCSKCFDRCREEEPFFVDKGDGHLVACHLYDEPDDDIRRCVCLNL
ncbi:MAG TPA: dipeptide ABC transporter ATP-binding protein [Firmicutes bacterium]|jgi:oligopeptide/dipeptide ABC transporter ATP-binding protein|nr:dipeptide ABC transporter ATP-binding protein [Bacillota bacterium]